MSDGKELYRNSIIFGTGLGAVCGMLLGAATGALSVRWAGIQFGAGVGLIFGVLTGSLTGALTARTAETSGGVSIGAYSGMLLGGVLGTALGFFIPDSFRADVASLGVLVLQVMTQGRFETAILLGFLLSVIGTAVGAWVGGRNLKARDL